MATYDFTAITRTLQFLSKTDIFDSALIDAATDVVCARTTSTVELFPFKGTNGANRTVHQVRIELRLPCLDAEKNAQLDKSPDMLADFGEKVVGTITWTLGEHDPPILRVNHSKVHKDIEELFGVSAYDEGIDAHLAKEKYLTLPAKIGVIKGVEKKHLKWRLDKRSVGLYHEGDADFPYKASGRPEPVAELIFNAKIAGKENEGVQLKHRKLREGHTYLFYYQTHNLDREVETILSLLMLEIFRRGAFGLPPHNFKEMTQKERHDRERQWADKKERAKRERSRREHESGKQLPASEVLKILYQTK